MHGGQELSMVRDIRAFGLVVVVASPRKTDHGLKGAERLI